MDSITYLKEFIIFSLLLKPQFRIAHAAFVGYLQPTQPSALHCCMLLTPSIYNEVIITLQFIGVNAGQMACILLTEIGSQAKYMLGVSEQIQKKIRGTKEHDWRGKIPLGVNRAEMY